MGLCPPLASQEITPWLISSCPARPGALLTYQVVSGDVDSPSNSQDAGLAAVSREKVWLSVCCLGSCRFVTQARAQITDPERAGCGLCSLRALGCSGFPGLVQPRYKPWNRDMQTEEMGGWKLLVRLCVPIPGCARPRGLCRWLGGAGKCPGVQGEEQTGAHQPRAPVGENTGFSSTSGWRQLDQILLALRTAFL